MIYNNNLGLFKSTEINTFSIKPIRELEVHGLHNTLTFCKQIKIFKKSNYFVDHSWNGSDTI